MDKKQEQVLTQRILDLQKENEALKAHNSELRKALEEITKYGEPDLIAAVELFRNQAEQTRELRDELKELQREMLLNKAKYQKEMEDELDRLFPYSRRR